MKTIDYNLPPKEMVFGEHLNELMRKINENFSDLVEIEITGEELVNMVGDYTPGFKYKITDFRTKHNLYIDGELSNTVKIGDIEPLTVTALSATELSPYIKSDIFPNDEIVLDLTDTLCEDGITPRLGKIVYRRNRINNVSTDCDFRTFKVSRKIPIAPNWVSGVTPGEETLVTFDGVIYKKSKSKAVGPVFDDTDSPDTNPYFIKWGIVGLACLSAKLSAAYHPGQENFNATGITYTNVERFIFDNGTGVESSDDYRSMYVPSNEGNYPNICFQNPCSDITFSPGASDLTFLGECTRSVLGGGTTASVFYGVMENVYVAARFNQNICFRLENVQFSGLAGNNVIVDMVSCNSSCELASNDIHFTTNTIYGSDIWGNIIIDLKYGYLSYHFDYNFVGIVLSLSTFQRVEYSWLRDNCEYITVLGLVSTLSIPEGSRHLELFIPYPFGFEYLLEDCNITSLLSGEYHKKLTSGADSSLYMQYIDDQGVFQTTQVIATP